VLALGPLSFNSPFNVCRGFSGGNWELI